MTIETTPVVFVFDFFGSKPRTIWANKLKSSLDMNLIVVKHSLITFTKKFLTNPAVVSIFDNIDGML